MSANTLDSTGAEWEQRIENHPNNFLSHDKVSHDCGFKAKNESQANGLNKKAE